MIKTGAQKLAESKFSQLAGQRVGLITNQTARVGKSHLINLLVQAPNVELISLFGPEHGIRGIVDDAVPVADTFDDEIGVPIHSLYGKHLKPLPETLSNLDIIVFDIQDIGARFYTYISTMGLAMQAASEAKHAFHRPRPAQSLWEVIRRLRFCPGIQNKPTFEGQYHNPNPAWPHNRGACT